MADPIGSGKVTQHMIEAYNEDAEPTMFLSGWYQSPPRNFHKSQEVQIDVRRSGEKIAIAISDLSVAPRMNEASDFVNKAFIPPIFGEQGPVNAFDLIKRFPGQTPFQDPNFRGNLGQMMFEMMRLNEAKIRRTIEVQASQIFQTGIVSLIDSNGTVVYTIDFKPKSSHFPTAGIAWDAGGATIAADISAVSEIIRNDGKADPNQLFMGINAYNAFADDPLIQALYDNRRMNRGEIRFMEPRGEGGMFRGTVNIGNYNYDIWTYGGRFEDPDTGLLTQYLTPSSCIVRVDSGRLDATFGAIPHIGSELGIPAFNILPDFTGRFQNAGGGMDMQTYMYVTVDGRQLFGVVETRALMIPTAIDRFGNIDTQT